MATLENLVVGARVRGLSPTGVATIKTTEWFGEQCVQLLYLDEQGTAQQAVLYRDDEPRLSTEEKTAPWSFDADGDLLRLASEAYRIHLAWLFDPYVAITTSTIEPLPHQIGAVYEEMLPRQPMRFLLADDPGAGKTIMAGLLIKELITWFEANGWAPGTYGDAETLAKARNVSVAGIVEAGVTHSADGKVRLLKGSELPDDWDPSTDTRLTVWEATQHLIKRLEEQGEPAAAALLKKLGPVADNARDLAYRLYSTCERKGWADDARAFNGLVIAWPELEKLATAAPAGVTPKGQLGFGLGLPADGAAKTKKRSARGRKATA